jgi:hypothetical protein
MPGECLSKWRARPEELFGLLTEAKTGKTGKTEPKVTTDALGAQESILKAVFSSAEKEASPADEAVTEVTEELEAAVEMPDSRAC